ncbi:hypothetical protein F4561_003994 [Lipingzhangella halophila]|uniref:Uncharacterized protein n=1 Tax=Lipingzhangella halophila TaxID=1783352 RepID=A0A7W7RJL5_9ACTN|nr:hypothetical protein [Lipingzhangella halophila]MBB4933174.1 hypothetical protein [Lipingzhangella halophila]
MTLGEASGAEGDGEGGPLEGEAGPRVLLQDNAWSLFGLTFATYWRNARALLAATAVPSALVAVLTSVSLVLLTVDGAIVNGMPVPWGVPPVWVLVVGAAAVGVGVALSGIALGAGVLVGGAALLGRRVAVADAWRAALRRLPASLIWTVLMTAVLLALTMGAATAYGSGIPLWVVIPAALVLAAPAVPVFVALPVAHLEGIGIFRAVAVAWRMARGRWLGHYLFVLGAMALSFTLTTGVSWAVGHLPGYLGPGVPLGAALSGLALVVAWPWMLLLLAAPVAYSDYRPELVPSLIRDCDAERVDQTLPPEPAEGRSLAPLLGKALVPVVLVAALLVPGLLVLNPLGAPAGSDRETGIWSASSTLAVVPDDTGAVTLAGWKSGSITAVECAPVCSASDLDQSAPHSGASQAVVGDEIAFAYWRNHFEDDVHDGIVLGTCDKSDCTDVEPLSLLRPPGDDYPLDARVALAPLGDGLVVVLTATGGSESETATVQKVHGYYCADTDCGDPQAIELPAVPTGENLGDAATTLGVATGDDSDGFAVSAYDAATGAVHVISCPDTECAEPAVHQVVEPEVARPPVVVGDRLGARVQLRPDGTPVVVYRAALDGAVHVVDCQDAACAEFTDRAVTAPGWARPVPGLDLDSEGRPQIATFDLSEGRLVLVSCADSGCAESETVPLARLDGDPVFTELALDPADRPHVVWGQQFEGLHGTQRGSDQLFSCLDARCGA